MKFLPSSYIITIENCISKNIESFAMKVPSFQGIFRASWKQRSNKNQLFQGTFSRFLQLFQGTFHWFLQFFQGTFESFTSTLFWFKQTNSKNSGGIPPFFHEFNTIKKYRGLSTRYSSWIKSTNYSHFIFLPLTALLWNKKFSILPPIPFSASFVFRIQDISYILPVPYAWIEWPYRRRAHSDDDNTRIHSTRLSVQYQLR